MRYLRKTVTKKGKMRYEISTNVNELELLHSVAVHQAQQYETRNISDATPLMLAKEMRRVIAQGIGHDSAQAKMIFPYDTHSVL